MIAWAARLLILVAMPVYGWLIVKSHTWVRRRRRIAKR